MKKDKTEENKRGRRCGLALAVLLAGPLMLTPAPAQTVPPGTAAVPGPAPLTLREAAQMAVLSNPEVLARWHTVRAAEHEREAARGGLLPRADLNASTGPERRSSLAGGSYARSGGSLSLTQLLYDGFATRDEVRRLDHAARMRVFELIATAEGVALEAARAYVDVLRYRQLVQLAEENFVEHRAVYAQTEQRVKARVARAVDLEQITGRLALAEANLLIETANLHDTTARFQRIVGRMPAREMPPPPHVEQGLPGDARAALALTSERNPAVLAAIEGVRAADAALAVRKDAYAPRLDFRLRRDYNRNVDGVPGSTHASVAEFVLNWNLFNGFSDRARERQFAEQREVARDTRDKTCRDLRQTTMIAFNDVAKLKEQLEYLQLHESSLAKALTAYRLQFQIGQRSLLDLLDTENERFQARRSVVNAQHDLGVAYLRAQAGVGNLLRALELSRPATGADEDLAAGVASGEAAQQCPAEPVAVYTVDKDALVQRAMQQVLRTPQLQPVPEATAALTPGPSVASVPEPAPAAPAAEPQVRTALEAWRAAWERRDVAAYLQAYGAAFTPPQGLDRAAWEQRRRAIIGRAAGVSIALEQPEVTLAGPDRATTAFTQVYRSASYQDRVRKTLEWQRVDGRWVIVAETAAPLR